MAKKKAKKRSAGAKKKNELLENNPNLTWLMLTLGLIAFVILFIW